MRPSLPFRALLLCYPAAFRGEYADEMWRVYVERRSETRGAPARVRLWCATIQDTVVTAAHTHLEILWRDLRHALRSLRGAPAFTATVLVVAALGIGVNTAAFSLTDHVLLRSLPYEDPSRLVVLWQNQIARGYPRMEPSPANYRDWKEMSTSFEGMGAVVEISANLVGSGPPQRLPGAYATADALPLLGVRPALGRLFTADEDRDGAPCTALLSWGLWRSAFAGDPAALGRSIRLDGEPCAVIGVMPEDYAFPSRDVQFWRPMRMPAGAYEDRGNNFLNVVARLEPGVTLAQARADMDLVSARLERDHPVENEKIGATVTPMRDELSPESRLLVLALSGAAACVLLIACLNLASMLLARSLARRKELALRAALGATRERLVRQLVTEGLLLAVGAGLLGLLLAYLARPLLTRLVPTQLPIAASPAMDLRVLGAAAAATAVAAIAFGLFPALRACRDPDALREGSRAGHSRRRTRLRRALVIAEVGASLVLLVGTGLLLRALWRVEERDPGFRSDAVVSLQTWLTPPRYTDTRTRSQFYDRVLADVRALPGVSSAAYVTSVPMDWGGGIWPVAIPERPQPESDLHRASLRFATADFFSTLDIRLRAGRDLAESDTQTTPLVAVVSDSFARRYWPSEDPLGKRFTMAFAERTVVGVVGDVRMRGLEQDSEPQVYLPYRQARDDFAYYQPRNLVIRSTIDPAGLIPSIREIITRIDPDQPISDTRTLQSLVDDQTARRRVHLRLIGAFAALAFLMAGVGLYGLLSFTVSTRSREIAVRMALGAAPRSILAMVLREGLLLTAAGVAIGLVLAHIAGRSLEALLVGVAPTDAPTLAAAVALALAMTLIGSAVPAWRAARVDPATVLRAE